MRFHLMLTTALVVAGPALASSIDKVGVVTRAGSIVVKSCTDCPAPKPVERHDTYLVPALKSGTQTVELKDINGQKKMVRTEAWMGGSPVVYISAPPQPDGAPPVVAAPEPSAATVITAPVVVSAISTQTQAIEAAAITMVPATRDGIDQTTTTSAVETDPAADTPVETAAAIKPLDASNFELRLKP